MARPANLFGVVSNHKVGVHKNRIDAADAMTEAKVFADKNQLAEVTSVATFTPVSFQIGPRCDHQGD